MAKTWKQRREISFKCMYWKGVGPTCEIHKHCRKKYDLKNNTLGLTDVLLLVN